LDALQWMRSRVAAGTRCIIVMKVMILDAIEGEFVKYATFIPDAYVHASTCLRSIGVTCSNHACYKFLIFLF